MKRVTAFRQWKSRRKRISQILEYGSVLLGVLAVLGLRELELPFFRAANPYLLFLPVVILAAWRGGLGPALTATFLSALAINYFLITPHHLVHFQDPAELAELASWILFGGQIIWAIKALEKQGAEAAAGHRILNALMANIPEGVIVAEDQDVRVKMVSHYGQESIGGSTLPVKGITGDRFPGFSLMHQAGTLERADLSEIPLSRAIKRGEVVKGEEWVLRHANGTAMPILCNAGPIRDEYGRILGGVMAWSDMTEIKKAMEAIRASDQRFRVAMAHAGVTVFSQDEELRYTWIYNSRPDLPDSISVGMTDGDLFSAEEAGQHALIKRQVLETGAGRREDIHVSFGDQSRIYDLIVEPMRDADGRITGIIGSMRDITERRQMEETLLRANIDLDVRVRERTEELSRLNKELEAERQRLFSLMDTLPFFVCLVAPDRSIRFANRRFRAIFGDAKGLLCHQAMAGSEAPCRDCPTLGVFATGTETEWEWTASDGRRYHMFEYPFTERERSPMVLKIGIDITERRRAEEEVQRERNQLRKILGSMPDGVYIVNRRHEIEYINPAIESQFGQLLDRRCFEYFHDRTEVCPWCKNQEVFAGKSHRWEWRSLKTGRSYDLFDTPLVNPDGSVSKLEIFHDITERKVAEEALRESEQQLRLLSAELMTSQETERRRIARELHDELGQGLSLIKLQLSLMDMDLPSDHLDLKASCQNMLAYMDQLIENVRRLSRDLCPVFLDSMGLVAALRRLSEDYSNASNIQVSVQMEDVDGMFSQTTRVMLYRIFQEALTNVLKHAQAKRVEIAGRRQDSLVVFRIEDNGRGMDVDEVVARAESGAGGFGLSTIRERLRMLGGSLDIESRAGEGTCLSFCVPQETRQ